MGIDLVEQGGDYLVLRSQSTGSLYAVVFETVKGAETPRIAPLAAWLSRGELLGPGDLPASRAASVRRESYSKPGEAMAVVERLLKEHGPMTGRQIAETGEISLNSANSAARSLLKQGRATFTTEPREGNPHLSQNRWSLVEGVAAPKRAPQRPRRTREEKDAMVLEVIQGADGPLTAQEINERLGLARENTSTFETVNRLVSQGVINRDERPLEARTPSGALVSRPVRVYSYANEPNGPDSSQGRESSESTQPVEGL